MSDKRCRFENFLVYEGNKLAHAAMYEVSAHPDQPLSPMYLYSGTGLGKTHLVNAAATQLDENGSAANITITNVERFKTESIYALRMKSLEEFYQKYECADVLIMENFRQLSGYGELQILFQEIFDVLQEKDKQIILTSDVPPDYLMGFDRGLLSKVKSGYTIEIEAPGFDERVLILEAELEAILREQELKVEKDNLGEIFYYIADAEANDIRKLKGMLKRVAAFAKLLNEELDFAFTQKILRMQSR